MEKKTVAEEDWTASSVGSGFRSLSAWFESLCPLYFVNTWISAMPTSVTPTRLDYCESLLANIWSRECVSSRSPAGLCVVNAFTEMYIGVPVLTSLLSELSTSWQLLRIYLYCRLHNWKRLVDEISGILEQHPVAIRLDWVTQKLASVHLTLNLTLLAVLNCDFSILSGLDLFLTSFLLAPWADDIFKGVHHVDQQGSWVCYSAYGVVNDALNLSLEVGCFPLSDNALLNCKTGLWKELMFS